MGLSLRLYVPTNKAHRHEESSCRFERDARGRVYVRAHTHLPIPTSGSCLRPPYTRALLGPATRAAPVATRRGVRHGPSSRVADAAHAQLIRRGKRLSM